MWVILMGSPLLFSPHCYLRASLRERPLHKPVDIPAFISKFCTHTGTSHTHMHTACTFPRTDAPAASLPPPPNSHSLAGLGVSLPLVKVKRAAESTVLSMRRLLVGSSPRPCGLLAPGWKKDRMGPPQKQMSPPLRGCAVQPSTSFPHLVTFLPFTEVYCLWNLYHCYLFFSFEIIFCLLSCLLPVFPRLEGKWYESSDMAHLIHRGHVSQG